MHHRLSRAGRASRATAQRIVPLFEFALYARCNPRSALSASLVAYGDAAALPASMASAMRCCRDACGGSTSASRRVFS